MVAKTIPKLVPIPGTKGVTLVSALLLNHKKGLKHVGAAQKEPTCMLWRNPAL